MSHAYSIHHNHDNNIDNRVCQHHLMIWSNKTENHFSKCFPWDGDSCVTALLLTNTSHMTKRNKNNNISKPVRAQHVQVWVCACLCTILWNKKSADCQTVSSPLLLLLFHWYGTYHLFIQIKKKKSGKDNEYQMPMTMVKTNLLFIRVYRFLFLLLSLSLTWNGFYFVSIVWNWTTIVLPHKRLRQKGNNKWIKEQKLDRRIWFHSSIAHTCILCSEKFGFIFEIEKSSMKQFQYSFFLCNIQFWLSSTCFCSPLWMYSLIK